jgi:hypothetical protein
METSFEMRDLQRLILSDLFPLALSSGIHQGTRHHFLTRVLVASFSDGNFVQPLAPR